MEELYAKTISTKIIWLILVEYRKTVWYFAEICHEVGIVMSQSMYNVPLTCYVVSGDPRTAFEQDRWHVTLDGLYSLCWGAQDRPTCIFSKHNNLLMEHNTQPSA